MGKDGAPLKVFPATAWAVLLRPQQGTPRCLSASQIAPAMAMTAQAPPAAHWLSKQMGVPVAWVFVAAAAPTQENNCSSNCPGVSIHFPSLEEHGSTCHLGTHCYSPGKIAQPAAMLFGIWCHDKGYHVIMRHEEGGIIEAPVRLCKCLM